MNVSHLRHARKQPRGFTLLEVILAAAISLMVIALAFVAVSRAHQSSIGQERSVDLASQARLVMELIGRDIRNAGDSVQFLPAHCLQGFQSPGAPFGCPAILEPHPWRITLSRYVWEPGPDGLMGTADDVLPMTPFDQNGANVVAYQFVPTRRWSDGSHTGYIGRLERVVNPFGFGGADPEITILLDNVLVDNRMSVSPDGSQTDSRRDHAVFMYRLLSVFSGEYEGEVAFTQRSTVQGSFILPPMHFFAIPDLSDWPVDQQGLTPPYLPTEHTKRLVGLKANADTTNNLRRIGGSHAATGNFQDDLRYVLDFNRIRAVNVSFKILESREDPHFHAGIDVNPDTPGTARVIQVESTFELKVFSGYLQ